jgi:hypothetical protein
MVASMMPQVGDEWLEFFYLALWPWIHYVPVREDMSDAKEKLEWAMAPEHEVRPHYEGAALPLCVGILQINEIGSREKNIKYGPLVLPARRVKRDAWGSAPTVHGIEPDAAAGRGA